MSKLALNIFIACLPGLALGGIMIAVGWLGRGGVAPKGESL
jgi:hypothetical protein